MNDVIVDEPFLPNLHYNILAIHQQYLTLGYAIKEHVINELF